MMNSVFYSSNAMFSSNMKGEIDVKDGTDVKAISMLICLKSEYIPTPPSFLNLPDVTAYPKEVLV